MVSAESPKIQRHEERGFFLTIPFPGEKDPTVLYVADKDFLNLKELVGKDKDTSIDEFRDELQELLDHSGHNESHSFSEPLVKELMTVVQEQPEPEQTEIDDPLDNSNIG